VLPGWKLWWLGLALAVGAGALAAPGALAAGTAPSAPAPAAPGAPAAGPSLAAALAARLGVTPARLEAAVRAAELERWNAFARGHAVPVERAAAVRAQIEQAPLTLVARFGPGGNGLWLAAASYLGLTPSALAAELRQGRSLADVAQARGKAPAGLREALWTAAQAELDRRVAGGSMSVEARQRASAQLQASLQALLQHRFQPSSAPARLLAAG